MEDGRKANPCDREGEADTLAMGSPSRGGMHPGNSHTRGHEMQRWYVHDYRASTMRKLGWVGPSIDRIVIATGNASDIEACSGANSVVARIQFDNRHEELTDSNMADALLIAAAPELYDALARIVDSVSSGTSGDVCQTSDFEDARAALAKARGEQHS